MAAAAPASLRARHPMGPWASGTVFELSEGDYPLGTRQRGPASVTFREADGPAQVLPSTLRQKSSTMALN